MPIYYIKIIEWKNRRVANGKAYRNYEDALKTLRYEAFLFTGDNYKAVMDTNLQDVYHLEYKGTKIGEMSICELQLA